MIELLLEAFVGGNACFFGFLGRGRGVGVGGLWWCDYCRAIVRGDVESVRFDGPVAGWDEG